MQHDWEELRDRTVRVRAALPAVPATPLTEAEITEAELQFGVTLPSGYREFLRYIDSGGHGPAYRLRRLSRGPDGWAWEGWPDLPGTDPARLTVPFPDQDDVNARLDALAGPQWGNWDSRCDEIQAVQTTGTITIAGDSTFPLLLVATGPQRGTLWLDMRATSDELVLLRNPDGSPATFTDLYLQFLVTAERLLAEGRTELSPYELRTPMIEAAFHPDGPATP